MPRYKYTVVIGTQVTVEADNEYDAAAKAARQHDGDILSVTAAGRSKASSAAPTARKATKRTKVKNTALARKAKARWAPGGDLRKAADARKAAAKKAAAKKR